MTATRQTSRLEQEITALGALVTQYKDDFALRTQEASLLVSSYERVQQIKRDQRACATYASQCARYYEQERAADFFNDAEIGRRIFAEVTRGYVNIQSAIEETK